MFEPRPFALNPVNFFDLAYDCKHLARREALSFKNHTLPATESLTNEAQFAKVAMGWSDEGIALLVQVNRPAARSSYPAVERGDGVELFLDTRDLKSAGFNTRFCHHFFFLPHAVDGVSKGEITHFRTEDSHPLCDPQELECQVSLAKKEYKMNIFIPASCLYGYDPKQFRRLGFTYRISSSNGEMQHFSVLSQEYAIDQQPSLWASLALI